MFVPPDSVDHQEITVLKNLQIIIFKISPQNLNSSDNPSDMTHLGPYHLSHTTSLGNKSKVTVNYKVVINL